MLEKPSLIHRWWDGRLAFLLGMLLRNGPLPVETRSLIQDAHQEGSPSREEVQWATVRGLKRREGITKDDITKDGRPGSSSSTTRRTEGTSCSHHSATTTPSYINAKERGVYQEKDKNRKSQSQSSRPKKDLSTPPQPRSRRRRQDQRPEPVERFREAEGKKVKKKPVGTHRERAEPIQAKLGQVCVCVCVCTSRVFEMIPRVRCFDMGMGIDQTRSGTATKRRDSLVLQYHDCRRAMPCVAHVGSPVKDPPGTGNNGNSPSNQPWFRGTYMLVSSRHLLGTRQQG